MDLLKQILTELNSRKGDWPKIATDNEVSYSWLTKLAQGKIPNPGINTIIRLYDYLFPNSVGEERRRSPGRRVVDTTIGRRSRAKVTKQ